MISVVVPARNSSHTLAACLEALLDQTVARDRYEIIVVDDGSTDGTARIAARYGVRYLSQPWGGVAEARNRGVQAAQGDLILFTDSDCVPAPDWIEAMLQAFEDPTVHGVKGVYGTRQRNIAARFVQAEYEDKYDRMRHAEQIDFIDTYSAGYRRWVLEKVGGFDPTFHTASEDVDLSFRLARLGFRLVFTPKAIVYHRHAPSLAAYIRRKFYVGYWRVPTYRRHREKVLRDTHTPQSLKLQIGLAGLLVGALPGLALFKTLRAIWAAGLVLFFLTTIPFARKTWRKDRLVGALAPPLLLLRALVLGAGFGVALWHVLVGRGPAAGTGLIDPREQEGCSTTTSSNAAKPLDPVSS